MSRANDGSGSVDWHPGTDGVPCWHVRVSLKDSRPWVPLPGIPESAREAAKTKARQVSVYMRKTGCVPETTQETVSEYFERWIERRELRGLRSARNDKGRFKKWVAPHLGPRPIVDVTKDEIKAVVRALDDDVRAGKLAWKTAVNVFGQVTKLFSDACGAKESELCVRSDNPAASVRGPDRGVEKSGPYLFPSEWLQLANCDAVPLFMRQIYALAIYLYPRAAELVVLEWADFNLDRGYVLIHRAKNTDTGKIKSTKTKRVRKVPIEPSLMPLLREMHEEADGEGPIVEMRSPSEWASSLRRHLKLAGVNRADLFANDETRRQLSFHDLRHTGITWRAVRGDAPFDIKDGAGHTDLETTQGYVNEGRVFAEGFGQVFPPLPPVLSVALSLTDNCFHVRAKNKVFQASPGGPDHSGNTAAAQAFEACAAKIELPVRFVA